MKNPDSALSASALDASRVEALVSSVVAPDRETFVWLCQSDIELGYAAEVNAAADRVFGPLA